MSRVFVAKDAEETRAIGRLLSRALRPGDVVVLAGDLGAGKTTFVQGVAAGLGVDAAVTSPTFVLAREYRLPHGRLVHADAYRLDSLRELDDLSEDVLGSDTVTLIEWGEIVGDELGPQRILVRIAHDPGGGRRITLDATHAELMTRVERDLGVEAAS